MGSRPSAVERELGKLGFRFNSALAVGGAVRGAAWGLALGCLFLLYPRAFQVHTPFLRNQDSLIALGIGLAAVAIGIGLATRRFYTIDQIEPLLDRRADAHGLLMAVRETEGGGWGEQAGKIATQSGARPVPYNWSRFAMRLLPFVAFVGVILIVPKRLPAAVVNAGGSIAQDAISGVEEKLDLLAEEQLMPQEQVDEIRKQIDELRKQAKKGVGPREWELRDSLDSALSGELQKAADALLRNRSSMAQAAGGLKEGEIDRLKRLAARSDIRNLLTEMMKKRFLRHLSPEGKKALDEIEQNFREAAAGMEGTARDRDLLESLRDLSRALGEKQQRLGDMADNRRPGEQGPGGTLPPNLDDLEMENLGSEGIPDFDAEGNLASQGGTEGDSGALQLGWKEPTNERDAKLRDVVLRPGEKFDRFGRLVYGVSLANPDVNDPTAVASGRSRDFDKDPGKVAWRQNISPRNRGMIRKYFSVPEKPETPKTPEKKD